MKTKPKSSHPRRHPKSAVSCLALVVLSAVMFAALPAAANASAVKSNGSVLLYRAASGEVNNVTISVSGSDYTITDTGATITPQAGCSGGGITATCPDIGQVRIQAVMKDQDDIVTVSSSVSSSVETKLLGQGGNDDLTGGDGPNVIKGQQGDDTLTGGSGDDEIGGGSGIDKIDGNGGAFDVLRGHGGNDDITGTGLLLGNGGDDTLNADNGFLDDVRCGGGNDTADVDLDIFSQPQEVNVTSCETVN